MQEKQEALKEKLKGISVQGEAGNGKVIVTANAAREITDVSISQDLASDIEQLEDLILTAINRALIRSAEIEATETQRLLSDMLPPGLGNLGNMFGK